MTALVWDQVGDRRFQTGVDRGVLYLSSEEAVPWNGLTGIEESSSRELKQFYMDGVKYLEHQLPGDFAGKLKAFTYPDEFEEILGVVEPVPGAYVHDQAPKSFGLSYRTRIGNDVDGIDHGYRIHILWNLQAVPDAVNFASIGDATQPIEFSWSLTATPIAIDGFRPTAHLSFSSLDLSPDALTDLEALLYGDENNAPVLPAPSVILSTVGSTDPTIIITDNGDGSYTAEGDSVYMVFNGNGLFNIENVDGTANDDEFEISTTY